MPPHYYNTPYVRGVFTILTLLILIIWGPRFFEQVQTQTVDSSKVEYEGIEPMMPVAIATGTSADTIRDSRYHKVTKVVDGDTIAVNIDGTVETLRLIGINTPETVDPRRAVECFGKEASEKAKTKLINVWVRIEEDESQGARDKYGRKLAYIFLQDEINFNEYMIREGYAYEYTYRLPYKYQSQFKEAQLLAREEQRGLWAPGACDAANFSARITTNESGVTSTSSIHKNYACDKNTYNCTSFNSQQEAQTVFLNCGGASNDVHKLDSDKDGVVCEGLP